ncbi:MAG: hypothetical protein B7Z55_14570, partial [Planctomycetales bacterium 12-60-4]
DDDDESRPGLVARVTEGEVTVSRVVTDPIVAPHSRQGHSRHAWSGQFLVRGEGPHQFHAHLAGKAQVKIGDRVVLDAASDPVGWASGPVVELAFGEFPLEITADIEHPTGQLKLYWSSPAFPLEPLPYHALYHAADDAPLRMVEQGRDFVDAWRCRTCHSPESKDAPLPGPSLKSFGTGSDVGWLRDRLTRLEPAPHGRMPAFGFSALDADAILAYLAQNSKPPEITDGDVKRTDKEVTAGAQLIKSVGCLGCHQWQELGKNPLFGGGPLDDVGKHRSAGWLLAKVSRPHELNSGSRMPTLPLSDAERRQIVAALTKEGPAKIGLVAKSLKVTDELALRGKQLIREARCGACHELPGDIAPFEMAKPQALTAFDLERSCVGGTVDAQRRQPRFPTTATDAIAAYLESPQSRSTSTTPYQHGERLLRTKGCL